ncbi:hypothetical protein REH81_25940 [Vibrio rotiferianus]
MSLRIILLAGAAVAIGIHQAEKSQLLNRILYPIDGAYGYELGRSYDISDLEADGFKLTSLPRNVNKSLTKNLTDDPIVRRIRLFLDKDNDLTDIELRSKVDRPCKEYVNIFTSIIEKKYPELAEQAVAEYGNAREIRSGERWISTGIPMQESTCLGAYMIYTEES